MGAIIWQKEDYDEYHWRSDNNGVISFPRNGIIEIDYEFILIFKKPGKAPKIDETVKIRSQISKEKWKEYFFRPLAF